MICIVETSSHLVVPCKSGTKLFDVELYSFCMWVINRDLEAWQHTCTQSWFWFASLSVGLPSSCVRWSLTEVRNKEHDVGKHALPHFGAAHIIVSTTQHRVLTSWHHLLLEVKLNIRWCSLHVLDILVHTHLLSVGMLSYCKIDLLKIL